MIAANEQNYSKAQKSPPPSPMSQIPTNYNDTEEIPASQKLVEPKLEPAEHDEVQEGLDQLYNESFSFNDEDIDDHINSIRESIQLPQRDNDSITHIEQNEGMGIITLEGYDDLMTNPKESNSEDKHTFLLMETEKQ